MSVRISSTAVRLHAVHRPGDGLPVVFLNSLAADLSMWDEVIDRMPGHEVLAFDARGHGQSAVVSGDADIADFAADTLAAMDAAGIDRAVLCGLSLGGLTAMTVAATAPERVAGLALANTGVDFPPADMWRDRAATARRDGLDSLVDPTLARWLTDGFRDAHPARAAAIRAMIAATPPEGYAAACAALATGDGRAALSGYGGPVLAIAGARDASTPPSRAAEMAELQPRTRSVTLEAAHLSSVEAPDAFAAALRDFVAGIEGGTHG